MTALQPVNVVFYGSSIRNPLPSLIALLMASTDAFFISNKEYPRIIIDMITHHKGTNFTFMGKQN